VSEGVAGVGVGLGLGLGLGDTLCESQFIRYSCKENIRPLALVA
jgi:hypothetical protein